MGEAETLRETLVARSAAQPNRLAYDDSARQVTFGELAQSAEDQAARLASMGVRRGDRVAFAMSAGIPLTEAFWAIQLLGATSCSFNPAVPAEILRRRAERIRPRLVLTDDWLDGAPRGAGPPPEPDVAADDTAVLQATSGTSGEPRAAMISNGNVVGYLRDSQPRDSASEDDVLVAWVPPWHDLGLIRFLVAAVYYGSACHIIKPAVSTIPLWLQTVSRVGGTVTGAPDFAYRLACRMVEPASVDLSSLRYSVNGGEPVRASTIERFERRFGLRRVVQPGYGLAEVTLGVSSHALDDPLLVDGRGNVACGTPVPGVEVLASRDASAPDEILVRTRFLFQGYFDAPDETRKCVRDGLLHTGDVGYMDDDGQMYVLGRSRGMLKRGGAVIAPRELEEAAQEVEGVRVAAAVSAPDEAAVSEVITVVVETTHASEAAGSLASAVSRATAATVGFAPGRVLVVPPRTVPLTANGKIRYDALRAMVADGVISTAGGEPAVERDHAPVAGGGTHP